MAEQSPDCSASSFLSLAIIPHFVFCFNDFARRLSKDFVILYTYLQFLKLRIAISQKSDYNNSVKRETFSRRLPPVYFRQINRTQTAEYRGLRRNGGLL
jgi:hypothetical protein